MSDAPNITHVIDPRDSTIRWRYCGRNETGRALYEHPVTGEQKWMMEILIGAVPHQAIDVDSIDVTPIGEIDAGDVPPAGE